MCVLAPFKMASSEMVHNAMSVNNLLKSFFSVTNNGMEKRKKVTPQMWPKVAGYIRLIKTMFLVRHTLISIDSIISLLPPVITSVMTIINFPLHLQSHGKKEEEWHDQKGQRI